MLPMGAARVTSTGLVFCSDLNNLIAPPLQHRVILHGGDKLLSNIEMTYQGVLPEKLGVLVEEDDPVWLGVIDLSI